MHEFCLVACPEQGGLISHQRRLAGTNSGELVVIKEGYVVDLVSVIIPCYRQADFVGEAIESVLAQTHPAREIVVVDDGSPDHTSEVVRHYSGVRYVHQDNQGVAAARYKGIQESKGTYLVFLDADDRLLPTHLEVSLNAFKERPDAAFVCGDYRWFGAEGTWHVHNCQPLPDHYALLLRFNFIGPPQVVMFKRDILLAMGGFRRDLTANEDPELHLRLARAFPIYCHHEVIAEYRRHEAQASQNYDRMLKSSLAMMRLQRPHVKGIKPYEQAHRIGIRFRQHLYGEALVSQVVRDVKSGRWHRATQGLLVLLRFYPQGVLNRVRQKLSKLMGGLLAGQSKG